MDLRSTVCLVLIAAVFNGCKGEVSIEFKDSAYSVVEDLRIYNVIIVKQGEPAEDTVVFIVPTTDPTSPDHAEFSSDYNQTGQITIIPGGPDEITTQMEVMEDSILEGNETFLLTLSLTPAARDASAYVGVRNESRITVINDDMVQVMFQQQLLNTDESSQAQFSVIFTPQLTEIPFIIEVKTNDSSIYPDDAEADIDYQPLWTFLTLDQFQATRQLTVNIFQDSRIEGNESFAVQIIIPKEAQQLGVSLGSPSVLYITIIDDDPLEVTLFTMSTSDELSGLTVQLFFDANQNNVTYRCRINDQEFVYCTSPHFFGNVDSSQTVIAEVEGRAVGTYPLQTATTGNKTVFVVMGGLQVAGDGAIAVELQASKHAAYRCRLNNGESIYCFDGQVFQNLTDGLYTLFIEATAINNVNEVAYTAVGPVLLVTSANSSMNDATAQCFGRKSVNCNDASEDCQYIATWRTRGDRVKFTLVAQTQGWAGIGFSTNREMPNSDIIVGAANDTTFFVDNRYAAEYRTEPLQDSIQNVDDTFASIMDGILTVQFSRDKNTGDTSGDLSLHVCRYLLFAWSGNASIETKIIQFHGRQNTAVSDTLICFPSSSLCPEKFDCGDPGTLDNGSRNFTDTLEGSVVTYTCNTGFEIVGNLTQTCEVTPNGVFWSSTRPQCTPTSNVSSSDSIDNSVSVAVIIGALVGTLLLFS